MDRIGKYEVLDKIGSGGFAVVYKGYDPFIKRLLAIKVCYSRDEETRKRFHREAEIVGRLVHRNITAVYDFGVHEEMPYLVEEYLSGEDLAHMVRRHEPETLDEKVDVLLQIANGLAYAHSKNVIHRDIKPSNIRILDDGQVKIMDFGTAKLANVESNLTQTGMTLGTVAYLSPERLLGQPSGLNSDLFSYGVLAYEMLSFRRPFVGRNIPSLIDQVLNTAPVPLTESWPDCPASLAEIVHGCLSKDPAERYSSSDILIRDLEQVRADHCSWVPATTDSIRVVTQTAMQATGLLERARSLHGRGQLQRAGVLLEEVLELDPKNAPAQVLLAACQESTAEDTAPLPTRPPAASADTATITQAHSSQTAVWEGPGERRARKIGEALLSIETYIGGGQLVRAAEALKFATEFLGEFDQSTALLKRIVDALTTEVDRVRDAGLEQARRMMETMTSLRLKNLPAIELAEPIVEWIEELGDDDSSGRHILSALRRDAGQQPDDPQSAIQARKRQEAVDSVEKLLTEGDPAMAAQALQFAVRLFGEFDQVPRLQKRISRALRESKSE